MKTTDINGHLGKRVAIRSALGYIAFGYLQESTSPDPFEEAPQYDVISSRSHPEVDRTTTGLSAGEIVSIEPLTEALELALRSACNCMDHRISPVHCPVHAVSKLDHF
jgi:hypothetical protein